MVKNVYSEKTVEWPWSKGWFEVFRSFSSYYHQNIHLKEVSAHFGVSLMDTLLSKSRLKANWDVAGER